MNPIPQIEVNPLDQFASNDKIEMELHDVLYMNKLKKSAEHFFDLKVAKKRAKEEQLALKQERQQILKNFFMDFDKKIKCKMHLDKTHAK